MESQHFSDLCAAERRGLARVGALSRVKATLARRWQSDGAIRFASHVVCLSKRDKEYIHNILKVPLNRVTVRRNERRRHPRFRGRNP